MHKAKFLIMMGAVALLLGCNRESDKSGSSGGASDVHSQSYGHGASGDTNAGNYAPDNTGRNQRDRSGDALTSGDQGSSESDLTITREIRRAVTSDDQFSSYAKNIKIITQNGKVTLRGPVKSAQEQQSIGELAKGVRNVSSVDNQLEVKANQ